MKITIEVSDNTIEAVREVYTFVESSYNRISDRNIDSFEDFCAHLLEVGAFTFSSMIVAEIAKEMDNVNEKTDVV